MADQEGDGAVLRSPPGGGGELLEQRVLGPGHQTGVSRHLSGATAEMTERSSLRVVPQMSSRPMSTAPTRGDQVGYMNFSRGGATPGASQTASHS